MPKVNIPGVGVVAFPDSMRPAEIERHAARLAREGAARATGAPAASTGVGAPPPENYNLDWARAGVAALPAIGGAALPLSAGPVGLLGGAGLAALGGAGGEAVRQHVTRAFPQLGETAATPLEAVGGMGRQALTQAGAEVGGRALGGAVKMAGKELVRSALRPTPTLAGQFPNLTDFAVGEGRIPLRAAFRGGIKELVRRNKAALRGMGKEMNVALDEALKEGNWYSPEEFLATVQKKLKPEARANPLRRRYMRQLRGLVNEYRHGWQGPVIPGRQEIPPGTMVATERGPVPVAAQVAREPQRMFPGGEPMSPRGVRQFKRSAQKAASPIYGARARGADPGLERSLEGEFQAATARDARAALAGLPTNYRGLSVADLDELMQQRIGLGRAAGEAERRYFGSGLRIAPPAVNWMIPSALRQPGALYPAGLALTDPLLLNLLRQSPRLAELGLMEVPQALEPYQP